MRIALHASRLLPALAAFAIGFAHGQQPPQPKPPCPDPASRQFDFWLGEWDVFLPDGKKAGTNRIEPLYGCGLHEHWKAARMEGQSFNRYDADRDVWHQTWVDSTGGLLLIEGGLQDGSMVMSDAVVPGRKAGEPVNEIRWTPGADGTVRQLWRVSKDGGKTWAAIFDGKYVRAKRE